MQRQEDKRAGTNIVSGSQEKLGSQGCGSGERPLLVGLGSREENSELAKDGVSSNGTGSPGKERHAGWDKKGHWPTATLKQSAQHETFCFFLKVFLLERQIRLSGRRETESSFIC